MDYRISITKIDFRLRKKEILKKSLVANSVRSVHMICFVEKCNFYKYIYLYRISSGYSIPNAACPDSHFNVTVV